MLFLPHSTALRLGRPPYVTYTVTLLCIFVFYLQLNNQHEVDQSARKYCGSIYKPPHSQNPIDALSHNLPACVGVLSFLHEQGEQRAFVDIEDDLRSGKFNSVELGDVPAIMRMIRSHLDRYQQVAPASLDGFLMHFPYQWWNPIAMITSSLAHSGWSHIIFNLIFFMAFTPALEVLINNKLKFTGILVAIAMVTSVSYSFMVLMTGDNNIPTLGLSGVVTGMIGLSAYLMPHARIRVFVWFITLMRNFFIPAWVLAAWYIGWDAWDLLTSDDYGGVNLVAHVSGGIAGYFIGVYWLKEERDAARDELEDEIEYMQTEREFGNSQFSSSCGRRKLENEQRQKQAGLDYEQHMSELYRLVSTNRDSDAIVLMLKDYDIQSGSVEIFEQLFERAKDWGPSPMLMCLGRTVINLLLEKRKYARALMYIEQCQQVSEGFVLADPANVLLLASMARENHQYDIARLLVKDAESHYGKYIDIDQCVLMENDLVR